MTVKLSVRYHCWPRCIGGRQSRAGHRRRARAQSSRGIWRCKLYADQIGWYRCMIWPTLTFEVHYNTNNYYNNYDGTILWLVALTQMTWPILTFGVHSDCNTYNYYNSIVMMAPLIFVVSCSCTYPNANFLLIFVAILLINDGSTKLFQFNMKYSVTIQIEKRRCTEPSM